MDDIAGNNSIRGDETVTFTDNMSFDGTEREGRLTTNAEVWMGSAISPHVRKASLTTTDGSLSLTYSEPTVTTSALDIAINGPVSVPNGGTGAVTLTGVLTGNGTDPITGSAITEYGVLIGDAANAVTSTVVGTAGDVLTSNGAGVAPTYQTPTVGTVTSVSGTANRITSTGGATPVIDIDAAYVGQTSLTTLGTVTTGTWNATVVSEPYGGTNQTTYTTGDILYASAANTLSKLAIGTAADVLTVAAGIPSWSAPAGGGFPSTAPAAMVYTDFIPIGGSAVTAGFGWASLPVGTLSYTEVGHPGVTSPGISRITSNAFRVSGGTLTAEMCTKFFTESLSGDTILFGFFDQQNTTPANGVYFRWLYATGFWECVNENTSTETLFTTAVDDSATWHIFQIEINAAGTSVTFRIDGVDQVTQTTNIPATTVNHYTGWESASITDDQLRIDYIMANQDATRA